MKVYLLDRDSRMVKAWKKYFGAEKNIEICEGGLTHLLDINVELNHLVLPANSKGLLDTHINRNTSEYCNYCYHDVDLFDRVKDYIQNKFNGEQPVGTTFVIYMNPCRNLIHAPIVSEDDKIVKPENIALVMRKILETAEKEEARDILITALGKYQGFKKYDTIAKMMKLGYDEYLVHKKDKTDN